jgi:hypothetical protein
MEIIIPHRTTCRKSDFVWVKQKGNLTALAHAAYARPNSIWRRRQEFAAPAQKKWTIVY